MLYMKKKTENRRGTLIIIEGCNEIKEIKGKIKEAIKREENQNREGGHCKKGLMDSYCQRKYVHISAGRGNDLYKKSINNSEGSRAFF